MLSGICLGMSWQHLHQPCVAGKVLYLSLQIHTNIHIIAGVKLDSQCDVATQGARTPGPGVNTRTLPSSTHRERGETRASKQDPYCMKQYEPVGASHTIHA